MKTLSKNARLIRQIGELLTYNGLTELDLGDLDDLDEPTSILHSDNDGNMSDDPVTKVFWDGHELSVEVDNTEYVESQRVYQDEFDIHTDWLEDIRDNVIQVLRGTGLQVPEFPDDQIEELAARLQEWQYDVRAFLVRTIRELGGRISISPHIPLEEYPVTTTLYGSEDFPRIDISDVYLDGDILLADGYLTDEYPHERRTGFRIENEHLSDVFSFVRHAIH